MIFSDVFRDFFAEHAYLFYDAPDQIGGEQNLEYYALFQRYLRLYENTLQDYIESLNVSVEVFYAQLVEVKNDENIKDKKLLHFVNYLLASTDYASFYKVMVRAAKKSKRADAKAADANVGGIGGTSSPHRQAKAEGKDDDDDFRDAKDSK